MKLVQNSWFKKILMIVCLGAAVAGGWYYFHTPQTNIQEFVESRDMQKILDLFDKNWYWLTPQTREEFDPSVYFKYRTHSHSPAHFGKLLVKVLYEKESFVGFIAYYKEQFYSGRILFITIDPVFRSKGYGAQLLAYAVKDLQEQGASVIRILTRTENFAGQALYKKSGFKEDWRDNTYVEFIKYL